MEQLDGAGIEQPFVNVLNILGTRYEVEYVQPQALKEITGDRSKQTIMGYWDEAKQKIFINADLKYGSDVEFLTVLHEAIHAADSALGLGFGEQKTNAVATMIYALVKNNPGLFKRMMQEPEL
jgi:hypothetical protein